MSNSKIVNAFPDMLWGGHSNRCVFGRFMDVQYQFRRMKKENEMYVDHHFQIELTNGQNNPTLKPPLIS